jgi:hypothetical protein
VLPFLITKFMEWKKSHFDQQRGIIYYFTFFMKKKIWKREGKKSSEYAIDSNSLIWFSTWQGITNYLRS